MKRSDLNKLVRILGLLGADQDGERASAALAAHRLVARLGLSWADIVQPSGPAPIVKTVVHRVREYGVDQQGAADARMRQLKATNDRLETQNRALRHRLAVLTDRDRRRRAVELEVGEAADIAAFAPGDSA